MWVSALLGMVTKYSEILLAVKFREKNENGANVGGPMYYIKNGLGVKWLASLFAVFAMIACIGGSKESKKVAVFHMFFNVLGALMFMGVTYAARPFLESVTALTPEVDPMVQIALCHMVFNFGTAIIFLPLLTPITKLINIIFKDKEFKLSYNIFTYNFNGSNEYMGFNRGCKAVLVK
jgi:AGCS family alanine or glycine:cation symporter